MSATYYTSLTGMLAASYGLQNTSNNIANMQSPGFKRNDVFYSSLGNGSGHDKPGPGVYVGGHATNFSQGTYLDTKNASDLAIVGNGFFIVKLTNGELLYTRDGEFGFNKDGILIDQHSGGVVQGYNTQGSLAPISRYGSDISPGKATHTIDLKGEFIIIEMENTAPGPTNPDPHKSKYEQITFETAVYDEQGIKHDVRFTFESLSTPGATNLDWTLLKASCPDADIDTGNPQLITFNSLDTFNGSSASTQNHTINFTFNKDQIITLNFGSFQNDINSSVRLYKKDVSHTKSTIEEKKQDGNPYGKQIGYSFDDNGLITYSYDNGQTEEGIYIALSLFDDMEHTLVQAHDNLFRAKNSQGQHIGRANQQNFGTIQPGKVESSNVDSTMEFANIVVLQRMFQACSQIMDIDKQLLEELYKK